MSHTTYSFVVDGERSELSNDLLERYSRPGPRYTSYPTVPEWTSSFGPEEFGSAVEGRRRRPLSLYVHLPFCHSLCLYCGCNVIISKDHGIAAGYLARLKQEIDMVASSAGPDPVEQIHWGGGTPTYISEAEIEDLFGHIASRFRIAPDAEIGIEIEPRTATLSQLRLLRDLGFNRISMGVQDFDPIVQRAIKRIQPYEDTLEVFDHCRALAFDSINLDLIYGLPHQTARSFRRTVNDVIAMSPDRIALFSYAHVPWLKKQQKSFERNLPSLEEKFSTFAAATTAFDEAGYRFIGLDHFVRPDDELSRALDARTLHRNFQGYTTKRGCDLLGVGLTSISSLESAYAQNQRELPGYYDAVDNGRWPTMRGAALSADDIVRRDAINRLMCHGAIDVSDFEAEHGVSFSDYFAGELAALEPLEADGLVAHTEGAIVLTSIGRIFARNVAAAFDAYLTRHADLDRRFSRTV